MDSLVSKRYRALASELLEPLALKYIDVAFAANKGKIVKEMLYQFKSIYQNSNSQTIQNVVAYFIKAANENITGNSEAEVDFLWDAYRTTLELLKNNNRVEGLYHSVSIQALKFCEKYSTKQELKRLCELLRSHLLNAIRYPTHSHQNTAYQVDISSPETVAKFLETRFTQLDVCVKLELWTEAFKSVEDVNHLIQLGY
jgi:translation initiation factor 3 subunit A